MYPAAETSIGIDTIEEPGAYRREVIFHDRVDLPRVASISRGLCLGYLAFPPWPGIPLKSRLLLTKWRAMNTRHITRPSGKIHQKPRSIAPHIRHHLLCHCAAFAG